MDPMGFKNPWGFPWKIGTFPWRFFGEKFSSQEAVTGKWKIKKLGGGNSKMLYFHPCLGKMNPF